MSEKNTAGNGFIGYEYKEITVGREMESLYADGYANFGWTLERTESSTSLQGTTTTNMRFKRDRKICNKAELTRLQRQFEACVQEIHVMERTKTSSASIAAFTIGLIGTAFLAGSVFAYISGMLLFSIVLAVPGFLGWILPYFVYRKIRKDKTDRLSPLIEQKFDEIYSVCEKANGLLNG